MCTHDSRLPLVIYLRILDLDAKGCGQIYSPDLGQQMVIAIRTVENVYLEHHLWATSLDVLWRCTLVNLFSKN